MLLKYDILAHSLLCKQNERTDDSTLLCVVVVVVCRLLVLHHKFILQGIEFSPTVPQNHISQDLVEPGFSQSEGEEDDEDDMYL